MRCEEAGLRRGFFGLEHCSVSSLLDLREMGCWNPYAELKDVV